MPHNAPPIKRACVAGRFLPPSTSLRKQTSFAVEAGIIRCERAVPPMEVQRCTRCHRSRRLCHARAGCAFIQLEGDVVGRCGTAEAAAAGNIIPVARVNFANACDNFESEECLSALNDVFEATGCTETCFAERFAGSASCGLQAALGACAEADAPDARCEVAADGSVGASVAAVVEEPGVVSVSHYCRGTGIFRPTGPTQCLQFDQVQVQKRSNCWELWVSRHF